MAIVVVVAALLRVVVLVAAGVGTAGKLAGRVMGMVKTRLFFVVVFLFFLWLPGEHS